MNYLSYLQYFKKPEYLKLLLFPHSIRMLDELINNEEFRKDLKNTYYRDYIHEQQALHWMKEARDISSNIKKR